MKHIIVSLTLMGELGIKMQTESSPVRFVVRAHGCIMGGAMFPVGGWQEAAN